MTRTEPEPTRWSIRQRERWIPLLGETYGTAYVEVRRRLMHGFVLLATFIVMSVIWDATMVQLTGDVLGVISVVFFGAAAVVSIIVPAIGLLRLEVKAGRHIRANGVRIRYSPDFRDAGVYLAWCRREGLAPENVARVLELPAHVPGR